jgi:hypothetical protein
MRLNRIGYNKRSVVVLGAGATRGAAFVENLPAALPPLDADFFTQAQRLSTSKPRELLRTLISDVVSTFGNNFELTMEGYLTRLEQLSHVLDDYRFQGRPGANRYLRMRADFLQVLAALLDESVGRNPVCPYHRRLVETLQARDTIVSLNYDWVIDHVLKTHGHNKWNPKIGYGLPVYVSGKQGVGTRYWACKDENNNATYPDRSILVLKLHGSMIWFPVSADRKPPRLELRTRWWHQNGNLKFEIAPPEWNKPTRSGVYVPVWRKAREFIRDARGIIFIGYSLPEADLPVQALLKVDSDAQELDLLITVNPDRGARNRIRSVLQHRLGRRTRILSFERFEDFYRFSAPSL